jgi:hypothetical protein
MIETIDLTEKEYIYLVNELLYDHKKLLSMIITENIYHGVRVFTDDNIISEIRKLAVDKMSKNEFDEIQTETAWLLEHFIDKLNKMWSVILSKKEYDYLINNLLKNHEILITKINSKTVVNGIKILVDEDTAGEIYELSSEEVGLHFDKNYEPTEEGWILEHLLDKFYF